MKKFKIFFLIIAAIAVMTSCASVNGTGKAKSTSEQVARDKADMNAMVDVARHNKVTVSEESKIETTDINGKSTSVYTDSRDLKTSATLTDIETKRKTKKRLGKYDVTSKVNAKVVEE